MAQLRSHRVFRRQVNDDPNSPYYCDSWYYCSNTAYIVKWAVLAALVVLFLGYMIGGHYHAKKRMARGLPPLRYHRWLVSRRARARFGLVQPAQNSYAFYRPTYGQGVQVQPQVYPMNNYGYAAPPPAYNEGDAVPVYTPPSKVNPDQSYAAPPPGGPPAGYNPNAGSSNLYVPPSQPARAASPFQNHNR